MNAKQSPPPASDQQARNDRLIQIAISLLSLRKTSAGNDPLPYQLSNRKWDHAFNEALKRADTLLQRLEIRDFDIHAYQVFTEGEWLTAENIAMRFKDIGWKGLASKSPVQTLFGELEESMQGDISEMEDDFTLIRNQHLLSAYTAITNNFNTLHESKDVQRSYPELSGHLKRLLEKLMPANDGASDHEILANKKNHQDLLDWCFVTEVEPAASKTKKYRAHEIFRYAALKDREGNKLTKTLSTLKSGFMPDLEQDLQLHSFALFQQGGAVF